MIVRVFLLFCLLMFRVDAWRTKIEDTDRFVAGLPASIEPVGFAMRQVKSGLFSALVNDSCGVVAIRITDVTVQKIQAQGLPFFETARQSRPSPGGRSPISFEDWQKIPRAKGSLAESWIMSVFECAGRSAVPYKEIMEGLEAGNGYVSDGGSGESYVLPNQKLFVYAFFH